MQNTTVIITSKFAQEEGKSFESQKFWDAKVLRCKPFEQVSPPNPMNMNTWTWTHVQFSLARYAQWLQCKSQPRSSRKIWSCMNSHLWFLLILSAFFCKSGNVRAEVILFCNPIQKRWWKTYDSIVHIWHLFGHYSGFIQAPRFYRQQSRNTSEIYVLAPVLHNGFIVKLLSSELLISELLISEQAGFL